MEIQVQDTTTVSVLVVDDNEMNVDLLLNMLERARYDVSTALSGEEALAIVSQRQPEVVLLDISMPGMDGYEVCRRIKADTATQDTAVIFISALDETHNIIEGFEAGAVDYITKPYKYREVLARVDTQVTLLRQKREIEALRQKELQHFERMTKLQRQFIGSATHDLKNPLFVISGYADMIEMSPVTQDNPQLKGFLESIRRGVDKMSDLVYDILELLQLEAKTELHRESIDLATLVQQVVDDMQVRADEKATQVRVDLPADETVIHVDVARMGRVLDNLISNAIKYSEEQGQVDVIGRVEAGQVVIDVIDDGLGIPDDVKETIFEPFQRVNTEEHMSRVGTGLGLSIVKTLVEQHGGSIVVESVLGEGSRFTVRFPVG